MSTRPKPIRAIFNPGGDAQKEGTKVPRSPIDEKKRRKLRRKFLAKAKRTKNAVYVSRKEILAILNDKLGALWKKSARREAFIGDSYYYCPPFDEVDRMLRHSSRRRTFFPEIFDCDDFSYELKGDFTRRAFANGPFRPFGFALGIVWLNKPFPHAMNWVISWGLGERERPTLYLVEPQANQIFDIDAKTGRLEELVLTFDKRKSRQGFQPYKVTRVPARNAEGKRVGAYRDIYVAMI
ncbi:MAG TPA: lectin MOA-related protein [Lacunisphaera sp.]|nr:lectin MOA-related protein [Lacunisphaera sp.]